MEALMDHIPDRMTLEIILSIALLQMITKIHLELAHKKASYQLLARVMELLSSQKFLKRTLAHKNKTLMLY